MIQPASLAIGFGLGVLSVLLRALVLRIRPRRTPLPTSIASPSPELVAAMSQAVAERYPGLGGFDYAAISVFERNSPDSTVYLYPARGPHRGAICLDPRDPSRPGGLAAQLLAEMSLPHVGVLIIPLSPR
ncbi:hypothetical protein [Streptomyces lavendulae]|uniref:hypothetical protein n=1 Tax=Streptomyces lavendulae TaxID=1914 RepID=UPI0024A38119|nr:hypothetical protein [Streptomyces lavendulae]GLX22576.1 hypothetical protein Slala01_62200 [Streptomyces lavendulae subsp. lavendulae]GLX30059.1 hypothetical protein Slala02_58790 [Streptomyces lavendulae subsp. lavendulae]